jgi:dipeptidase E
MGKPLSSTKVVFVGTAANLGVDDKSWMINDFVQFQKYHVASIDFTDIALPRNVWEPHIREADLICIGGGNERYLARIAQESGFKEFILPLLEEKVYMGISAGSMLPGYYLSSNHVEQLFPEEDYGSEKGSPMEILDMHFLPHLNSTWFKEMRVENLVTLQPHFTRPTYALDDNMALAIDGEKITFVGDGASWAGLAFA